jgi:hypothetical protein
MALPNEPTAAALAEFLRSNDRKHDQLSLERRWYVGIESWSALEMGAVEAAASRNTSIQWLDINVMDLSSKGADVVAQIISHLHHVLKISIWDVRRARADVCLARPDVVDSLLHGIMESQSSIEQLQLYGCCSARTIRPFSERFPNLQRLEIEGQSPDASGNGDTEFDDFALALALEMGNLPSLTELWLDTDAGSAAFLMLLSAVEASSTIESISLAFSNRSRHLLPSGFHFFASRCPDTLLSAQVQANTIREVIDISSLFPVGGGHASFAPSIIDVQFARCEALNADSLWFDRAAAALTHVESLGFFQCRFPPWALEQLLVKLPRLRNFYCLSRKVARSSPHTLDDEFNDTPFVLGSNDALAKLCQVIERPDSLLDNLDLDIVSSDDTMHFPAIESLLKHSKGELSVNFGRLPPLSSVHVVQGAKCLSPHLQVLCIRFCRCEFGDGKFASFLRALGAQESLKSLEFGFDAHASLGTPELSIAAIRDLVQGTASLNVLMLRGLGSDAVVTLCERIMPPMTTANRSLRQLVFFGPGLADVWPRIRDLFLAALQKNGVLFRLGGDLRVPDDDIAARHVLKQNQHGRQFLLPRDAPVLVALWAAIFARPAKDKDHGVMYAFLRSKLVSLLHPSLDPAGCVEGAGTESPLDSGRKGSRAVTQGFESSQADAA